MATYYVSKSTANGSVVGSDSANGTSLSTPWRTISKAVATAADGDTVLVNDGEYVDLELGAASVIAVSSAKSLVMRPIVPYAVTLRSTAASAQIVSLTGTANFTCVFGAFVIDGEIPNAPGTYQPTGVVLPNPAAQVAITLDGTEIKNCATQNILNSKRRGTLRLVDVVFSGRIAQGVASTASGADAAAMTVLVDGLRLDNAQVTVNALCRVLDFTRLSSSSISYSLHVKRVTGLITAPASVGTSVAVALLVATGIGQGTNVDGKTAPLIAELFDAEVRCESASATSYGIYIKNASAGATAVAHNPVIRRNTLRFNVASGYAISAGDTTTAYDVNYPVIHHNVVTVPYRASATPHCIAVGNVTGGLVYANKTFGGYVGYLAGINQGAIFSGNLSEGCYGYALYAKGCGATTAPRFDNNTVVLTSKFGAARGAGLGVAAQGGTNNAAVSFRQNIVYALTDLYRYAEVGLSQAATFTSNVYCSAGPEGFASPWAYQASTYATIGEWIAAREASALSADPLFSSGEPYRLTSGSPYVGTAAWYPNTYDISGGRCWPPASLGAYQRRDAARMVR